MSRIEKKFAELKERGEAALIPFITAGDPDLATTLKIMRALDAAGADCLELGIPFSDPTADGPTIQRSSERALKRPVPLPAIFNLLRRFRKFSQLPVVLFGYYNPFFRFGPERFARQAAAAGADGILCVDLPPEESAELKRWTDAAGRASRGFVYYVSVTGVTGARRSFDGSLRAQVARVRRATTLPVGVGFGISTPEQAAWIAEFADAAVVGSALVERIEKTKGNDNKARRAGAFAAELKQALRQAARAD